MDQTPKNLSNLFGKIVKALSLSSETDKTDFEPKTPLDNNNFVQAAEEALDHQYPTSSSSFSESSPIRLVIYRSTDCKEKEKILFDSLYVTDEGNYLPQKDPKFLRDTVLDFAFGSMPLRNPETTRFTKLNDEKYAFAIVFNLSTTTSSTTHSPRRPPPFQDSSTDSSLSSSGYSSLPILDDPSNDYSSSSLNPSHSLPATPCHYLRGSRYHRNSPRLTIGAVLLFSNQVAPPVLEPLLLPMKVFISQTYLKSKSHFSTQLKSYSNCLSLDVQNYCRLIQRDIPPALEILPLFNLKVFGEFIAYLSTNPCFKISVVASSKMTNLGLAIFKICYLIKNFKNYFPNSRNSYPQKVTNTTNNSDLDSGLGLDISCTSTTIKSSICDEDEELICDSSSSVDEKPRNKFYLGDEEDDEQTEEKLGLSEPMKEKLFPNQRPILVKARINVKEIPLELNNSVVTKPNTEHYCLNNTARFSPFHTYQLFNSPPKYDYIHTVTNEILEINLDRLSFRAINPKEEPSQHLKETIRGLMSKTRNLTKLITDTEKTLFFFLVHLVENMK